MPPTLNRIKTYSIFFTYKVELRRNSKWNEGLFGDGKTRVLLGRPIEQLIG